MPLTRQELESRLWRAADILRGQIDAADYKNYIFSILFLKRLSDRFEEEIQNAVAEGVPLETALADRDEHEFFVPESARWAAIAGGTHEPGRGPQRGQSRHRGSQQPKVGRRAGGNKLERRVQARRTDQP